MPAIAKTDYTLGQDNVRLLGLDVHNPEGATENAAVCQSFLANLQSRGLRTDRSLLVILDGALALHKAVRAVFGEAALIQRCQVHKLRNILDHLPERQRSRHCRNWFAHAGYQLT